jgi:uncharacterized RDD family membrane protein YckC
MTSPNTRPEEPELFDLPLAAPAKRSREAAPSQKDVAPQMLDLFPTDGAAALPEGPVEASPTLEQPAPQPRGARKVGLRDRAAADLLDLTAALAVLAVAWIGALAMGIQLGAGTWPAFAALGFVFSFLYQTIPLAFWRSTPGMVRRRLYATSTGGGRLTFGQATLRWTGWALTLGLAGLPYAVALSGRSLTDRLSRSRTRAIPEPTPVRAPAES